MKSGKDKQGIAKQEASSDDKRDRQIEIEQRLKDIEMGMSSEEVVFRILIALVLIGYALYSLVANDFYFLTKFSGGTHYHGVSVVYWALSVFALAIASAYGVFRHFCWRKKICQRWVKYKIEVVLIVLAFIFLIFAIK